MNKNISDFVEIAIEAGRIALRDFRAGELTAATVNYKNGGSPVTSADIAADNYLKSACSKAFQDYAWLSEETADTGTRLQAQKLIIADPIDGTRAFASGNPNWCVSLAMIENGEPVIGCLYAPALDELYVAGIGQGAKLNNMPLKFPLNFDDEAQQSAFGPMPMVEWLNNSLNLKLVMQPKVPSLALRLARIATGAATIGLASKNAHDWDIAASDLILRESGGVLLDFEGNKPVYNQPHPTHPSLFAASKSFAQKLLQKIADRENGISTNPVIDRSLDEGYRAMTADSQH
jgi:myo-inositol-1(or 4)-monophosphatase